MIITALCSNLNTKAHKKHLRKLERRRSICVDTVYTLGKQKKLTKKKLQWFAVVAQCSILTIFPLILGCCQHKFFWLQGKNLNYQFHDRKSLNYHQVIEKQDRMNIMKTQDLKKALCLSNQLHK